MARQHTRNPLLPLFIGLPIILLADLYVGYRVWTGHCEIPAIDVFLVLAVMPVLYLGLIYLTLKSQP